MGPPLAKRSDGALLIHADYLPGPALAGRSLWLGVVLEDAEAEGIRAGIEEASIELVSHFAGKLTTALEGEAAGRVDTPSLDDAHGAIE